MAINDAKWKSLTDQQRQAILKHSGLGIAMLAGWAWTNGDNVGVAEMTEAGVNFHTLSESEVLKMKEALQPLIDEWIAEADKRGLPGKEIYDYAKSMAHEYRAIREVNVP
jgi:TRAP-type C4-dicarboxylate transport system substrate-binding protein